MTEPATAITFSLGIAAGILVDEFVRRIPDTFRFFRRLCRAYQRVSREEYWQ